MQALAEHIVSNPESFMKGGLVVVSVVIFFMGIIKMAFKNMQNKSLRKFILAVLSIILTLPITAISLWIQNGSFVDFWIEYILNALTTVFVYWGYEVTGTRNLVSWLESLGKKILSSMLHHKKIVPDILKEMQNNSLVEIKQSYDDDLKI